MPKHEVHIRAPTPQEERLAAWFAEQHLKSPDHLEAAARQLIGLVTALLGLLLGVLAVAKHPLPAYLASPWVKGLGAAGVVLLLAALLAGLAVLWPRQMAVLAHDLTAQRRAFEALLARKNRALRVALVGFALGVVALAAVLVLALLSVSPAA